MELFRLKNDARQFFPEKFHTKVMSQDQWEEEIIPINLLDEVEKVYVTPGKPLGDNSKSIRGWSGDNKKGEFHFTVHVTNMEYSEYESLSTSSIMDEIQNILNKHFSNGK